MRKLVISLMLITCLLFSSCSFSFGKKETESSKQSVSVENTEYTAGDGSYLILGKQGEKDNWKWYQTSSDLEDNYYAGKYQFFQGKTARTFITKEIKDYGVTEEEIDRVTNKNYDNLVVFFVEYSEIKIDGQSQMEQFNNSIDKAHPKSISYYGQINEKGDLALVNMLSANQVVFTKKENTKPVDLDEDRENKEEVINDLSDYDLIEDIEKNSETTYHSDTEALNKIKFDIPENYVILNVTDMYVLYNNYRTNNVFCIYFFENSTLEKAKNSHKGGEDITVNGRPAYKYKDKEYFYFSIEGNGGEYAVSSTSEDILNKLMKNFEIQ